MKIFLIALLSLVGFKPLYAQQIKIVDQTQDCSFRGLSVVDNHVAWVSGSKGHVGISTNGGKTWSWQQVKGFEQSDFRDVEAFSAKEAVIMSSGSPALILKTADRGRTWKVAYRNNDPAYFLDAMAFATPQHGYAMGDPINGKFVLLETKDGGNSWHSFHTQPQALAGEAVFAASGTCIAADHDAVKIVTGGSAARLLTWDGRNWIATTLPVLHGKSSQGVFSTASNGAQQVFVGGDYQQNKFADSVACYKSQRVGGVFVASSIGYQSSVAYIKGNVFVSTGTPGTSMSTDGGKIWKQIDTLSFNLCQKAKRGKLVLLAGDKGKIAQLKIY